MAMSKAAQEIEAFFERQRLHSAPAWRPEPGGMLVGTVVGRRMGQDNGFGEYPVIIYKTEDGNYVAFHAFHTLARDILKRIGVADGARHAIVYSGLVKKASPTEEEIKKGNDEYHSYYGEDLDKPDASTEEAFTL